jgi:hypothetical protein
LPKNQITIRFKASLFRPEESEKTGTWALLTLPKNASAKLPSQSVTMVEGTINGFPFRAALEPTGDGGQRIKVNKALRDAAGADPGDTVAVEITRVGEEGETRMPMELSKALGDAPRAQALWTDITPTARQNWILWITTAKLQETRTRRIETACDMLASEKRRVCCFPGLAWITRDHVKPSETWLPLPNSRAEAAR